MVHEYAYFYGYIWKSVYWGRCRDKSLFPPKNVVDDISCSMETFLLRRNVWNVSNVTFSPVLLTNHHSYTILPPSSLDLSHLIPDLEVIKPIPDLSLASCTKQYTRAVNS